MELVHLPAIHRRSLETLSHSALSIGHVIARRRADVALVFNAANSPLLPALRLAGLPVATHVDGLEWRRGKWGAIGQRYYRLAESAAVRWSDALIADAVGISELPGSRIRGAVHSADLRRAAHRHSTPESLQPSDLLPKQYHLVVARLEPENHVHVIVDGYVRSEAKLPLVVVGSAPYAEQYSARVRSLADDRVRFLGGVWDQDLLNELYANALTYFHGHSVGGTNPSLLRAIGAGAATDAFDISFNREVLGPAGRFWSSPADVASLVMSTEADPSAAVLRGQECRIRAKAYDWDDVAIGYERLCGTRQRRADPTGSERASRASGLGSQPETRNVSMVSPAGTHLQRSRAGTTADLSDDQGSWVDRWWFAISVTALILASDYKIKTRESGVQSSSIDSVIIVELLIYFAVALFAINRHGRPPRIARVPVHVYLACFFVGLTMLSVVSASSPNTRLSDPARWPYSWC